MYSARPATLTLKYLCLLQLSIQMRKIHKAKLCLLFNIITIFFGLSINRNT